MILWRRRVIERKVIFYVSCFWNLGSDFIAKLAEPPYQRAWSGRTFLTLETQTQGRPTDFNLQPTEHGWKPVRGLWVKRQNVVNAVCFMFPVLGTLNAWILSSSGFSRWSFHRLIFQCTGFKLCSCIIFVKRDFGHTLENINIAFYGVSQMCCVTELILPPEHDCNYWKKKRAGLS